VQLVMGKNDTVGRARPSQPHEMFRSNVRREDRCPHNEPPEVPACKKVVIGRVLALADNPPSQNE
jgi:hypothetical protein